MDRRSLLQVVAALPLVSSTASGLLFLARAESAALPDDKPRNRGQTDPHLAIARAKIEDAETIEEALGYLNSREEFAVLGSPSVLQTVCAMPSGRECE